ncbi:MAG TPA: hypothetical protein DD982_15920, partial [Thalassospira sp.]|nr:hypothetical protein [Thalassospira sp.]
GMRPALAQAADPVIIRSGAHSGYGRIVLQWNKPVNYTAEIIGDQLVVRFDQPLVASMRGVLGPVSDYVSDGFFDPDGRTVAFVLRDDFEARVFNVGTNVVLDILDKPALAPAPVQSASPAPTPPRPAPNPQGEVASEPFPTPQTRPDTASVPAVVTPAATAPELEIRVGRHPTFYRLVFDWPTRTDYVLNGDQGNQILAFTSPARIDATGVTRRLPEGVTLRQSATDPLSVEIATNPPRALRHFRSGNKVVVDLMGVQGDPADSSASTAAAPPATAARRTSSPSPAPAAPAAP